MNKNSSGPLRALVLLLQRLSSSSTPISTKAGADTSSNSNSNHVSSGNSANRAAVVSTVTITEATVTEAVAPAAVAAAALTTSTLSGACRVVSCIRILLLNPEVAQGLVSAGVVPLLAVGLQGSYCIYYT
jgi:hypothetical protein